MNYDIDFYTDGSCSTKSREGGWGCIEINSKGVFGHCGEEHDTTNNRMELRGFLEALVLTEHNIPFDKDTHNVTIYSDSAYVVNCINNSWYKKWQENGWHTSNRTAVKNEDLWKEIIHAYVRIMKAKEYTLTIEKVKGHADSKYNNMADEYANKWRDK